MRWTPSLLTRRCPRLVSHTLAHPWACSHTRLHTAAHSHTLASHAHIPLHTGALPSCHSHAHTHTTRCFKCTLSLLIINILASYSNHSKIKYGYVGEQGESACRSVTRGGPWPPHGASHEYDLLGVPRPSVPPSRVPPGLGPTLSLTGRHPGPKRKLTKKINSSSHSRAPDAGSGRLPGVAASPWPSQRPTTPWGGWERP